MPNHRGVPAAEKYAELLANGQERPRCACHGEPMIWNIRTNRPPGGSWMCAEAKRARSRRYYGENSGKWREYRSADPERALEAMRRFRRANPEKISAWSARRVKMFGRVYYAPDMQFREHAVQLREERRRALKEASNG